MADDHRVPDFQLLVDGTAADAELRGSVIGIRITDDMDKSSRFWLHLSDVDRKWTKQDKFKPGMAIEIKLGYQGQLKSVMKGEISNLEVVYTPDGPSRLVVSGVDKGHNFDKGTVTKTYKDVKDSDLASQIAQRHGLTADADDSVVVHDYVIQNNLSDYDSCSGQRWPATACTSTTRSCSSRSPSSARRPPRSSRGARTSAASSRR